MFAVVWNPREILLENSDEHTNSRRSFLRGAAGAAAAVTGATAFSGTAAAHSNITDVESNSDQSLPVVDELVVYAHGWIGEFRDSLRAILGLGNDTLRSNFNLETEPNRLDDNLHCDTTNCRFFSSQFDQLYFPDTIAAYKMQAPLDFSPGIAFSNTESMGQDLAEKIQEFYDNGGGDIRLVGHSYGAAAVLHALDALESGYVVEDVALLAGAVPRPTVCGDDYGLDWDFIDGIINNAESIRNYHSTSDSLILFNNALLVFGAGEPIGFGGLRGDCSFSNWTDVDCTQADTAGESFDHFKYFTNDEIGADMARAFNGSGNTKTEITNGDYDIDAGVYEIENDFSRKILEVSSADVFEGANVRQWHDLDGTNQAWKIEPVASGGYRIAVQHTDMVLAPEFGDSEEGTTLVQEVWRDLPHQRWHIDSVDDSYRIRNIGNRLVVDVARESDAGPDAFLWEWHGDDNQQWTLNPV